VEEVAMKVSHDTIMPPASSHGGMAAASRGVSLLPTIARARPTGISGAHVRAYVARMACVGSLVLTGCGGAATNPSPEAMYSISGTVRGGAGFTISLSGTATRSTTTDGNGSYSFSGLSNGSYTVRPSDSAYAFSPSSLDISITSTDVTGQDFTLYSSATYWDGCTPDVCGPAMGAPNFLCTDGTIGGPGPCKRGDGGDCGWSFRSCDPVTLCTGCVLVADTASACEPPQAGESGPSSRCVIGPDSTCSELLLRCFTP
jgi:hypothetical protein